MQLIKLLTVTLLVCVSVKLSSGFIFKKPEKRSKSTPFYDLSNSITEKSELPPIDFSQSVSGLFGSYRIPAMLVAGAAYGGVFALPLSLEDDIVKQLAKRSYILIGIATVSCELLATIISTIAIDKLGITGENLTKTSTIYEYIKVNTEFEWVTMKLHFLLGICGFAAMCGLRAWLSLTCPYFGRSSLALIVTTLTFMGALLNECLGERNFGGLFKAYFHHLRKRFNIKKPLYCASMILGLISVGYMVYSYNHVYHFLNSFLPEGLMKVKF